jgi:hypothetical protein
MSDSIDYRHIPVPEDKRPPAYDWRERRAEILSLIEQAGHPGLLNQSQLAERYDTSQSNISKDFDRLRQFYDDYLGQDFRLISETVYRKAVREYVDRGEYDKAVDAVESWNDWLDGEGVRTESPDRLTVSASVDHTVEADLDEETRHLFRQALAERRGDADA